MAQRCCWQSVGPTLGETRHHLSRAACDAILFQFQREFGAAAGRRPARFFVNCCPSLLETNSMSDSKTDRRSFIKASAGAAAAVVLAGNVNESHAEDGAAVKTRKASCNCGQLRRYVRRSGPEADLPVPLQIVPKAIWLGIRNPSEVPARAGKNRRRIDVLEISHRGCRAGRFYPLRREGGRVSFLSRVRFDRLVHLRRR